MEAFFLLLLARDVNLSRNGSIRFAALQFLYMYIYMYMSVYLSIYYPASFPPTPSLVRLMSSAPTLSCSRLQTSVFNHMIAHSTHIYRWGRSILRTVLSLSKQGSFLMGSLLLMAYAIATFAPLRSTSSFQESSVSRVFLP